MVSPSISMQRKMALVLAFVFTAGFTVLIGRLIKLQFFDGNYYQNQALSQQLSVTTIHANRGTIYDRNMTPLAQSATVWDIYVAPSYIKTDKSGTADQKRAKIADDLSKILGLDRQTVYNKISKRTSYVIIASKIESDVATLVRNYKQANNEPCIGIVEDSKRYYPFNDLASQILGFTGSDNQGLDGIEAYYDKTLKGVNGRVVTAKNATGTDMPYNYQDRIAPKDGTSLVLTIDEVVQHDLEKNLDSALVDNKVSNGVTGIVMNVKTGEILGMATEPSFNPNSPFTITDQTELQKIALLTGTAKKTETNNALQAMWRDKAITIPYEPGSTFKIITAAAALNEGVVKESDQFFDPGYVTVSGVRFRCWKAGGHGSQTFLQGFENSCNVVFIEVGQRLGVTRSFKYFSNFGLAAKTGIDLPGEANSIYYTDKQMGPVELASVSFGQSNKITPIQLITAVSAVVNGGELVKPHVVKEEVDDDGKVIKTFGTTVEHQVISQAISQEMALMMEKEVQVGTGKNAYVAGYRIGGKTGTSQKLDEPNNVGAVITSFVGIAPADNPQIAILLLLDEPHNVINFGGVIAAPVVGNIFSEVLPYLGVKPQYTPQEQEKLDVKTPSVVGNSINDATKSLKNAGLVPEIIGNGTKVTSQIPDVGQSMPRGGKVVLYTGSQTVQDNVTIPKLTGLTPAQVNSAVAAQGLNIELVGEDLSDTGEMAYQQSPAEGTKVPPGTVVTVQFRNNDITAE